MATIYVWGSLCGIALSHAWRNLLKRRGWLVGQGRSPWLLIALLVVLLGIAETACVSLGFAVLRPPGMATNLDWLPGAIVGWTAIFTVWTTIYSSAISIRRAKQFEAEALRLEIYAKDSELRALQAQVNPHFFFNSLNSVRALIYENPNAAAQMIDQLAGIMRYALQSGAVETVKLAQEMDAVNAYLNIEKIRFEERLHATVSIEAGLDEVMIPSMALQTLVENAVKHGVERQPLGSEIKITVTKVTDIVQIKVANQGTIAPFTNSTKLGLENTRKRLALMMGEAATFELREENGWVFATIALPYKLLEQT